MGGTPSWMLGKSPSFDGWWKYLGCPKKTSEPPMILKNLHREKRQIVNGPNRKHVLIGNVRIALGPSRGSLIFGEWDYQWTWRHDMGDWSWRNDQFERKIYGKLIFPWEFWLSSGSWRVIFLDIYRCWCWVNHRTKRAMFHSHVKYPRVCLHIQLYLKLTKYVQLQSSENQKRCLQNMLSYLETNAEKMCAIKIWWSTESTF